MAGTFLPPGLTTSDVKIISGGTDNYVMTAVDGETIQGEASLQFDGSALTVGANTDGYDVKFFGNASGKYMLWDESEDDLIVIGDVGIGAGTGSGTLTVTNTGSSLPTALLLRNLTAVGSADTGVNIIWHGNTTGQSMAEQGVAWEGTDNADTYMSFSTRGSGVVTEKMRIGSSGEVFIGPAAAANGGYTNANMTAGLTINQEANSDKIFALKASEVAHGYTAVAETDTFFDIKKANTGDGGGTEILSLTKDSTGGSALGRSIIIKAFGGTAQTDKDDSAEGLASFLLREIDGNGSRVVTANGNVFAVRVYKGDPAGDKCVFLVDEDGDLYIDNEGGHSDPFVQVFDSYDDAQLLRALDHAKDASGANGMIKEKWDDFLKYNEQDLVEAGVLGDTMENNGLLNVTGLQRLHNGAIWQGYVRQQEMQEKIDTLENRLMAIEGAK